MKPKRLTVKRNAELEDIADASWAECAMALGKERDAWREDALALADALAECLANNDYDMPFPVDKANDALAAHRDLLRAGCVFASEPGAGDALNAGGPTGCRPESSPA